MEKEFKGKALYQPKGKAKEYSEWAVNFYTGCSNDCEYCYCKRGVLSKTWSTTPQLKKCFINENDAINTFVRELERNQDEISPNGIFFSFSTDPLLPETRGLTFQALEEAIVLGIPVKILTKRTDWISEFITRVKINNICYKGKEKLIAIGFTLTGFDDQEPGANSTEERIKLMRQLHKGGIKTFASIEPLLHPDQAKRIITNARHFCDLFKVGLISGKSKDFYKGMDLENFFAWLQRMAKAGNKIYPKNSFLEYLGIKREDCPRSFVTADYNLF